MVSESTPSNGAVPNKKMRGKVPKKIHKAEREKLKRDHLNDLFVELSHALDPARQNNGKATILCDASRILADLITQVGSLKKENVALSNESHYVTIEKNELEDDNAALQCDIDRLQNQIEEAISSSKPNSSALPSQNSSVPPVFVVPLSQDVQQRKPSSSSHISRPHARYPTPDSWSLEFLSRNLEASGVAWGTFTLLERTLAVVANIKIGDRMNSSKLNCSNVVCLCSFFFRFISSKIYVFYISALTNPADSSLPFPIFPSCDSSISRRSSRETTTLSSNVNDILFLRHGFHDLNLFLVFRDGEVELGGLAWAPIFKNCEVMCPSCLLLRVIASQID